MVSDRQRERLEERLLAIEKSILDSNNKESTKRLPARHFMLFLLIGGARETADLLRLKVQGLLSNPKACAFLYQEDGEQASLGQQAAAALRTAAASFVDVENLNEVLLCPVLFATEANHASFLEQMADMQKYIGLMGKTMSWQPVLVIGSRIEQYPQTYCGFQAMARFIAGLPIGTVNRCCVLSDQNEKGFDVPVENILETVAVCTVLQNTKPENADVSQVINNKIRVTEEDKTRGRLFFTARSASVANPVRNMIYQRMISAINFFSGDTDKQSDNALQRVSFRFIPGLLQPYMEKLPHMRGKISFFPLYGVMGGENFHERLEQQINQYYREPLYGRQAVESLSPEIKRQFFVSFFQNNGSLNELEKLLSTGRFKESVRLHLHECYGNYDIDDTFGISEALTSSDGVGRDGAGGLKKSKGQNNHGILRPFMEGEYEGARQHCEKLIKNAGSWYLSGLASEVEGEETLRAIGEVRRRLDAMRECLQGRQRQLRDAEMVLSLGQSERLMDFGAVQDDWFETIARGDKVLSSLNRKFDSMICDMLLRDIPDFSEMLLVCYDAVKNSIGTNADYLNELSRECAEPQNAQRFASTVEQGWCYVLQFAKNPSESDITCLIGDKKNKLCVTLKERFKATVFEFSGLDKLGVLHVSAPFRMTDLLAWKQIEGQGRETNEVER